MRTLVLLAWAAWQLLASAWRRLAWRHELPSLGDAVEETLKRRSREVADRVVGSHRE